MSAHVAACAACGLRFDSTGEQHIACSPRCAVVVARNVVLAARIEAARAAALRIPRDRSPNRKR